MKLRLAAGLLAVLLLLAGCGSETEQAEERQSSAPTLPSRPEETPVEPEEEPEPEGPVPAVYVPPEEGLTLEETIEAYFQQQYRSYLTFTDIDLSAILDARYPTTGNSVRWTRMLNQRRRLLRQEGLCYVETQANAYTIRYLEPEELEDQRLAFWDVPGMTGEDQILIHFAVEGEKGKAYPPIMPANAQHTMRLVKEKGMWKITLHYFPGSVRKFYLVDDIPEYTDEEMLDMLRLEFGLEGGAQDEEPWDIPAGAVAYSGEDAAAYALRYGDSANPDFYHIGDWMGDCANFNSQCVWAGFRGGDDRRDGFSRMTGEWYAGEGGGSPPWENVEQFYRYLMEGQRLGGRQLPGIWQIRAGDLIQTATGLTPGDEGHNFNHGLVVVDPDRLLLAQHTPASLVYYADIVNVRTRIVRPEYLMVEEGVASGAN